MTRLEREAAKRGVVIPTEKTLAKYGFAAPDGWLEHLEAAGWTCPVCERFPKSGKFVTDHEHVRGWAGMPDDVRRRYVRGVTCWHCNRYLLAGNIDSARALRVHEYLLRYEARRPA